MNRQIKSCRISVIGAGSWGGTMAQHLAELGHDIIVWHRNEDELNLMEKEKRHPFLPQLRFSRTIIFTSTLSELLQRDVLVVAVPSHGVRDIMTQLGNINRDTVIVNLAKGIENETLMRMSEIIIEVGGCDPSNVVSLYGPSHAEEVMNKTPTAVVAAGVSNETLEYIQSIFSSEYFRIYANEDIIGVELGGSVKNVIAIAAGVCNGIGYGDNTIAALITRGIVEITRLGEVLGAKRETFSGLSGIGDLIVTCLSQYSRNRSIGEKIGKGMKLKEILDEMHMVAEGVKTSKSVYELSKKLEVEMPICTAVYDVLFNDVNPEHAVKRLMTRELIYEHD
ncbi:MAG: NAD(P)-dependent glycerol-3-phosphate dehydrogenase [Candidatus Marinimicrobia bacterium]|nr:NAD(P)-dependent glycerol-3-phosphate dehydrogenase [Candidatus Neomarinimicrobiota bacterium]